MSIKQTHKSDFCPNTGTNIPNFVNQTWSLGIKQKCLGMQDEAMCYPKAIHHVLCLNLVKMFMVWCVGRG